MLLDGETYENHRESHNERLRSHRLNAYYRCMRRDVHIRVLCTFIAILFYICPSICLVDRTCHRSRLSISVNDAAFTTIRAHHVYTNKNDSILKPRPRARQVNHPPYAIPLSSTMADEDDVPRPEFRSRQLAADWRRC